LLYWKEVQGYQNLQYLSNLCLGGLYKQGKVNHNLSTCLMMWKYYLIPTLLNCTISSRKYLYW
jgi:hypothetical protein